MYMNRFKNKKDDVCWTFCTSFDNQMNKQKFQFSKSNDMCNETDSMGKIKVTLDGYYLLVMTLVQKF